MQKIQKNIRKPLNFTSFLSACCAVGLAFTLSACGSQTAQKQDTNEIKLPQLTDISAKRVEGKSPTVTFKKRKEVPQRAYAILDKGNAMPIREGDKICTQSQVFDATTEKLIHSTWEDAQPDCSIRVSKQAVGDLYPIITSMKSNGIFALSNQDPKGTPYIVVISLLKTIHVLDKANGKAVTNIPSNLPKVTVAKDGTPAININNYKDSGKLVSQVLLEGSGETVKNNDTVTVHYSGWLLNGKQFDSSWKRKEPFDANLAQGVIKGWTEGLAGKKVGSQVLLIIPPDLAYGNQKQGDIPANSTLVFVVDILATAHN